MSVGEYENQAVQGSDFKKLNSRTRASSKYLVAADISPLTIHPSAQRPDCDRRHHGCEFWQRLAANNRYHLRPRL
jgi:hypothetical protein